MTIEAPKVEPSLADALALGDLTLLPSRRDEDWRWTDLRGLIRQAPEVSPDGGAVGPGPFAGLAGESLLFVNGQPRFEESESAGEAVALRFVSQATDTGHATDFAIEVEAGERMVLLESYEGSGSNYVSSIELEISLGENATLERIVLADDVADAVSVSIAHVSLSPGARFAQTVLTSGAKRQRLETRLAHPGGGAAVRMDGAYVLSGNRHGDITTSVVHEGVDGATDQLICGVVDDHARGVFQGRITVQPGADRTDARMAHRALVIGERAEVDAKPELEIFADDVSCAHGNTVGGLDEEALFYMQQRGIPADEARRLLTVAFVARVVDRIEHEGARQVARAWVEERMR